MKMEILYEVASNSVIDALDMQNNKFSGKIWWAFNFVHVHGQFHTLLLNSMVEGNFIQFFDQILLYTIADSGSCHFGNILFDSLFLNVHKRKIIACVGI